MTKNQEREREREREKEGSSTRAYVMSVSSKSILFFCSFSSFLVPSKLSPPQKSELVKFD